MKQFILTIFFMAFGLFMVNATNVNYIGDYVNYASQVQVDGTYVGKATPTKMNGLPVSSGKSYDCTYIIEGGILDGSFKVGPHFINMYSIDAIDGTGTFNVAGEITLLGMSFPFEGTIVITEINGTRLSFTCHAISQKAGNPVSEFSFTTN